MPLPRWLTLPRRRNSLNEMFGSVLANELKARARSQTRVEVESLFEKHGASLHELLDAVIEYRVEAEALFERHGASLHELREALIEYIDRRLGIA